MLDLKKFFESDGVRLKKFFENVNVQDIGKELKDWDLFKCKELEKAPEWDGHTDQDVERLLSLEMKGENDEPSTAI